MFIRSDTGHNLIQFKLESACFFFVFFDHISMYETVVCGSCRGKSVVLQVYFFPLVFVFEILMNAVAVKQDC